MVDQGEHWFDPRSVCCFSHLFRLFCATVGSLGPQDSHGSWVPCSIATGQQVRVQGREEWPSSRLPLQLLLRGGGGLWTTHPPRNLAHHPSSKVLAFRPPCHRPEPSRPSPYHRALPASFSLQHFRVWSLFSFNPFIFTLLSLMLIFFIPFLFFFLRCCRLTLTLLESVLFCCLTSFLGSTLYSSAKF